MSDNLITIFFDDIIIDEDQYNAILFDLGPISGNVWIPRSLIEQLDEGSNEVEMPEWFALKEGLI